MDVRDADEDPRSDAELLAAIAGEDQSAFGVFYYRHVRWLTVILSRRSKDVHAVDVAITSTFWAVWGKPGGWRGDGSVTAWLSKIALNKLRDELHRSRTWEATECRGEGLDDQSRPEPSAEESALRRGVDYGELGPALRKLPRDLLAVVRQCWLAGLTTSEASRALGVPQGTVKTRLVRARAKLRKELDGI